MTHRVHIVDVFTERPYAGNPLAVVLTERPIPDETMQAIAAEMNFSETTFVPPTPGPDGGYLVRIYTPAREIAFAGHPILGTATVLRQHGVPAGSASLRLDLQVGSVLVTFETSEAGREVAWFQAPPVVLGPSCARDPMAAALGVSPDDIDPRVPVQRTSAGTSAMIVPLRSLAALRRCRLDLDRYAPLAQQGFPPLIYLFCTQTHDSRNDLSVRFFFEAHGVREDPATGNGAAFLGAYLLEHRFLFEPGFSLRIEQGHEVRRPSLILLRGRLFNGAREVSVGGSVVPTLHGQLL